MNFSRSVHSQKKGEFVWKRNANTSETNRKNSLNKKKVRLTSETSDYSNLGETEPSLNIKANVSKQRQNKHQWNELKSLAKYSTIASRMELKKSVPISFLDFTTNKSTKRQKTKSSFQYNTFDRVFDTQGNLTKSFKDTKQFKSLNPHITKDVNKMKKRVFSMYQQEKRKMNNFLAQNQTTNSQLPKEGRNQKSISLFVDKDENSQMQRISERQQYESKINSTRIKPNSNQKQDGRQNENKQLKRSFTKKEERVKVKVKEERVKVSEERVKVKEERVKVEQKLEYSMKKSAKKKNISGLKNRQQVVSSQSNNPLLKGLLGEYFNYMKLSKQQLIEKLICLQYLAQNIFKKNKFLEQEMRKKDISLPQQSKQPAQIVFSQREQKAQFKDLQKPLNGDRNIFVIDNNDGYFNEFLQQQKGEQQIEEQPQRFHQKEQAF